MDCWSKSESDSRYVLTATFNSLGTQVTALDGRVAALEASPLPADISCTSLTASGFVETPELRNTPIVLRAIDNIAAAGITLDQDVTVNAARTLGNVTTNGSILANQQIDSDLRLRAPLLESRIGPRRLLLDFEGRHAGHPGGRHLSGQPRHRARGRRGQPALSEFVWGH